MGKGNISRGRNVERGSLLRLKRLIEKERTRKMRKKKKVEKVGEDVSEEESTDTDEEKQPVLESFDEQDVAGTSTAVNEMERALSVVKDTSSSTFHQTEKGAGEGKDSSKETDFSIKDHNNVENSESEEASEEDGEEDNLWGAILGPK